MFTDDDLVQLRFSANPSMHLSRDKIFALLARLECAEHCLNAMIRSCNISPQDVAMI